MFVETAWEVFAGVYGALLGSFLNVCVHRLPRNESVIRPRSRCPSCGTPIAWYDNVPLVSWLVLRARWCAWGTYANDLLSKVYRTQPVAGREQLRRLAIHLADEPSCSHFYVKVALSYATPFVVSVISSVLSARRTRRV